VTSTGEVVTDADLARRDRLDRVRAAMVSAEVDVLVLSLGADLPWLSGYEAMPLERPTALVVSKDGEATLFVPELEAPRVRHDRDAFALRPWRESEDAVSLIAASVGAAAKVGISDRAWAGLLLGLQDALPGARFQRASSVTGPIRAVKDGAEIAALHAAGAAADRVADALLAGEIPLIGRREDEVSAEIGARLIAEGHSHVNFAIVGSGPNASSPHHEAGERRIGSGDAVVCDFGGAFSLHGDVGYCSDTTRTVVVGEVPARFAEFYGVLEEAQRLAVEAVRPGLRAEEIDRVGRAVISEAGFGDAFIHRIGHGIGIEEHEDPYVVEGNITVLVPGHAFSVEPGIYLAGKTGARIEDIVVVTESGYSACNRSPHGLTVLDR
jgi:Xaa-Pro aminopeptidase